MADMVDPRPLDCRARQIDEQRPYPRTGCSHCHRSFGPFTCLYVGEGPEYKTGWAFKSVRREDALVSAVHAHTLLHSMDKTQQKIWFSEQTISELQRLADEIER